MSDKTIKNFMVIFGVNVIFGLCITLKQEKELSAAYRQIITEAIEMEEKHKTKIAEYEEIINSLIEKDGVLN